ncbi:MAG TPA: adenosylcobinamide-GDP ribazoletransferase [Syntrophomonadaceae bacterium]|nr:adenosylcobinamide-GDP ribazoletransferase [Syntrophomonadaceae bacterium]
MRTFRLAISFLSIFPVYGKRVAGEQEMARSLFYYPLVGFLLGGFLVLAAYLGERMSLGLAGDVLVVVLWIILTGGLHLDGVMDTSDGIFSGRDRLRKLEIMKDSRIGAMGAIALIALLLLKVAFLGLLPYPVKYWVLLSAPALGRAMMTYPIVFHPYARPQPGLGRSFGDQASRWVFPVALIIAVGGGYLAGGVKMDIWMLLTGLLAVLAAIRIRVVLGGHTGDTYGFLCELTETMFIIIAGLAMH